MTQRVQTLRSSTKNTRPTAGTREPGELFVSFADLQLGVINAARTAQDLIAVRFFSAATNYAAGDFVINAGTGYRAKATIVAGVFNAADWDTLATAPALLLKEDVITPGTTLQYWRGDKTWQTLDKAAVGLDQVNNTSDVNKPVSTAQATADALRVAKTGDVMSGHLALPLGPAAANAVRKDYVDLGDANLTNAVALKADIASPTLTGDPRAPTPATSDNDTSIATTAYVKAQGYVIDAPADTNAYGRKGAAWVDVTEEAPLDLLTYGRKNGAWATMVGGAVVSDTVPPGPLQAGQLWWESDSGAMFLWYTDANSSQWVQVNNATAPGATAETRNRIVNPAMQISQENGNTIAATSSYYPADQWACIFSTTALWSQRTPSVTPNGSQYRLLTIITAADTSIAATDYWLLGQQVEGTRIADFRWGTAQAKPAVLRFTVNASMAGTFGGTVANGAANRSYVFSYTITAGQVGTDVTVTVVIPGDTTGTWPTTTAVAMQLWFAFTAGTTYTTAPGAWAAGNFLAPTGITQAASTVNSTFYISDVGLYLDPQNTGIAPPWQMPDEAQELIACKRYWESGGSGFNGYAGAVTTFSNFVYMTEKRTSSAFSLQNLAISNMTPTNGTVASVYGNASFKIFRNSVAAGIVYMDDIWTANARM